MQMQMTFHGLSDAMLRNLTSLSANEIGVIDHTQRCFLYHPSAPGAVSYSGNQAYMRN